MSGLLRRVQPLAQRFRPDSIAGASRQQTRGFADHGEVKVNAWEAPTAISTWKEEHIVFLVLGCWALGITTAMKVFGKKKEPEAAH